MVSSIILQILHFQSTPYVLKQEPTVRNFLTNLKYAPSSFPRSLLRFRLTIRYLDDKVLFNKSLEAEPREGTKGSPAEKRKKTLRGSL